MPNEKTAKLNLIVCGSISRLMNRIFVQRLMDEGAFTREAMIRTIFSEGSSFLDEGMSLLVQEFGRDYET